VKTRQCLETLRSLVYGSSESRLGQVAVFQNPESDGVSAHTWVSAHANYLMTSTFSALFSTLSLILPITNHSRLGCAETLCVRHMSTSPTATPSHLQTNPLHPVPTYHRPQDRANEPTTQPKTHPRHLHRYNQCHRNFHQISPTNCSSTLTKGSAAAVPSLKG